MTHVKAREWIKRLPERATDPIDAGCKGVLQAHWDHVDWDVERNATGRECWPTAETIAEEIGSTVKAVRDRISKLRAAGWMRRDGRGWALAWAVPFEVELPPRSHVPPESDYHPSGKHVPPEWHETTTAVASDYHPGGTKLSPDQDHERSDDQVIASADPTPVLDSPPTPKPTKTRKRKPPGPTPGQTALDIADAPVPDVVAELLEAHRLAHAAHVPAPAWPARSSKRYASMLAGCRKAVSERGVEWCRAMLEWRAGVWARDPSQHPYSTADVWRPACLDYAKRAMAGPAQARASPPARRGSWIGPLPIREDGPEPERIPIDPDDTF